MNESNIPREWWEPQDQDEAWVKKMEEELQQQEEESKNPIVLKEFDDAFLGFGVQFSHKVAIYDYARCIDILEKGGMPVDVAIGYMEDEVLSIYDGRRTPVFLTRKAKKRKDKKPDPGQLSFDFGGDV